MVVSITDQRKHRPLLIDRPDVAAWLAQQELGPDYAQLVDRYRRTHAEHDRLRDRPQVIRARLQQVSQELVAGETDAQALVIEQSRLQAEEELMPELQANASRAYADATVAIAGFIERHATEIHNAAVDAIDEATRELRPLLRIVETLPKPDGHDEAKARLSAIHTERIAPNVVARQHAHRVISACQITRDHIAMSSRTAA